MKYTISAKHVKLSDKTLGFITLHIEKVSHMFPDLKPDIAELDIVIRENKKKKLHDVKSLELEEIPTRKSTKKVVSKVLRPVYFDGTIKLVLPKKPLTIHLKGASIHQAVSKGFDRLIAEIETYKGKHYSGDSKYYDQRTIRHALLF